MAHPQGIPRRAAFMRNWFAVEAIPIVAIVSIVLTGGTWFALRSARGPTIQWTTKNPTPWNEIKPDEGTKLVAVNQRFDKTWVERFLAVQ